MRILVALAVLNLSNPVQADDTACRAAPTQACAFDMALTVATAEADLRTAVTGLLTVAALQESAGATQASAATIDRMIALIDAKEPDAANRLKLLDWSASALSDLIVDAPVLATRMAEHVGSDASAVKTSLKFAALAGDTATVNALLDAAPSLEIDSLILSAANNLMVRGDFVTAYAVGERNRTPAFRALLDETAVTLLLREGKVEAAEIVAAGMADPAARAGAIINVAQALTRTGDVAKAKVYADLAGALSGTRTSPYTKLGHAGILALAGDGAGAEALIGTISASELPHGGAESIRLMTAIMAGDMVEVGTLIASFDQPNRALFAVKAATLACLEAGTCEAVEVLAATKGPAEAGALNAIGLVQARAGNSADALATLEHLRALGPEARVHGDFRSALVLLLAKKGNVQLALELAAEGGNVRLLAELASKL